MQGLKILPHISPPSLKSRLLKIWYIFDCRRRAESVAKTIAAQCKFWCIWQVMETQARVWCDDFSLISAENTRKWWFIACFNFEDFKPRKAKENMLIIVWLWFRHESSGEEKNLSSFYDLRGWMNEKWSLKPSRRLFCAIKVIKRDDRGMSSTTWKPNLRRRLKLIQLLRCFIIRHWDRMNDWSRPNN